MESTPRWLKDTFGRSDAVRCVALVGQSRVGKTTLARSLLQHYGIRPSEEVDALRTLPGASLAEIPAHAETDGLPPPGGPTQRCEVVTLQIQRPPVLPALGHVQSALDLENGGSDAPDPNPNEAPRPSAVQSNGPGEDESERASQSPAPSPAPPAVPPARKAVRTKGKVADGQTMGRRQSRPKVDPATLRRHSYKSGRLKSVGREQQGGSGEAATDSSPPATRSPRAGDRKTTGIGGALKRAQTQNLNGGKSTDQDAPQEIPGVTYLIDTPGHLEFALDTACGLRLGDGAIVMLSIQEEFGMGILRLLRQVAVERVKPVLFVNGMDRKLLTVKAEDLCCDMVRVVGAFNAAIASYADELLGACKVMPSVGQALFGSASQNWATSIPRFAKEYATRFGLQADDLAQKMWPGGDREGELAFRRRRGESGAAAQIQGSALGLGEADDLVECHIGGPVTESQHSEFADKELNGVPGPFLQTLFVEPIMQVAHMVMHADEVLLSKALSALNLRDRLSDASRLLGGVALLQHILSLWLPGPTATADLIYKWLPSPKEAQAYRLETIYSGALDDEAAMAIRTCQPDGVLMVNIVRMLPCRGETRQYYGVGRVFSGSLCAGQAVYMRSVYRGAVGKSGIIAANEPALQSVTRMGVPLNSATIEPTAQSMAGHLVAVWGVESHLMKCGTLTNSRASEDFADIRLLYSAQPCLRVALSPGVPEELPELMKALRAVGHIDPLAAVTVEECGMNVLVGSGPTHLQSCLTLLSEELAPMKFHVQPGPNADAKDAEKSEVWRSFHPTYREGIGSEESPLLHRSSGSQHSGFEATAEPLDAALCVELEDAGFVSGVCQSAMQRLRTLAQRRGWGDGENMRVWCAGVHQSANLIVDTAGTRANDVEGHLVAACQWALAEGALCEEPMRGVCLNIRKAAGAAENYGLRAVKTSLLQAQLAARPCLLEPVLEIDIACPSATAADAAMRELSKRNARILEESPWPQYGCGAAVHLCAELPAREAAGLEESLYEEVGDADVLFSATCSRWAVVGGSPWAPGLHADVIRGVREWRQLALEVPLLTDMSQQEG